MKEIIILFTRVPKSGTTKTRLFDFVTKENAKKIQEKLLQDLYSNLLLWNLNIEVFHNGSSQDDNIMKELLGLTTYNYQNGKDLGEKMYNAILEVYTKNKPCKIILIGSDIVNISKEIINQAFLDLDNHKVVINPTFDGGYYLIGMKEPIKEIFEQSDYGNNTVFERCLNILKRKNLRYAIGKKLLDIDTKEDLLAYETGFSDIELLGAGEYNINFLYNHSKNEKRVLRLNIKSQMNLENQMAYEYSTLKLLEKSGVTPKVFDLVEKTKLMPYKYLTMEYLEGRPLNYNTDMEIAAYLLAKVHTTKFPTNNDLILANNPFKLMFDECYQMANHYLTWDKGNKKVKEYLRKFLLFCENLLENQSEIGNLCIINTELNSGNFIIGENKNNSYIIDWEKALIGECEQDLAHFLAPTTTYWKTDKILSKNEIEKFLSDYSKYNNYNHKKFLQYLTFNCLRGVTWSSMAYREYSQKDKILTDDYTFNKIKSYLEESFLTNLEQYFN